MTPEEIDNIAGHFHYDRVNQTETYTKNENFGKPKKKPEDIAALRERQQSISFAEWLTTELKWVRNASGDWIEREVENNPKIITTDELYTIFQEQNKSKI